LPGSGDLYLPSFVHNWSPRQLNQPFLRASRGIGEGHTNASVQRTQRFGTATEGPSTEMVRESGGAGPELVERLRLGLWLGGALGDGALLALVSPGREDDPACRGIVSAGRVVAATLIGELEDGATWEVDCANGADGGGDVLGNCRAESLLLTAAGLVGRTGGARGFDGFSSAYLTDDAGARDPRG